MTETDWKPGDVAIRTYTGDVSYEMRSMAVDCPDVNHYGGLHWHHENGGWDPIKAGKSTYRRLLVIDPEDREQVDRLVAGYVKARRLITLDGETRTDDMTTAIRAMLEPPKPPEVFRHYVHGKVDTPCHAVCGKLWTPSDGVTVMGDCPECVEIVKAGWIA